MRCSAWSSLAFWVCSALALLLAAPAAAHVTVEPPFLYAQGTQRLALSAPNERNAPMTGFSATVPDGVRVVHAHPASGWESEVTGSTATWLGGSVEPGEEATFELELEAFAQPGPVEIEAVQQYPDDTVVPWRVALTLVPGSVVESGVARWQVAIFVAALGLLVLATIVFAARRRRRRRSLQEE
jgi:uncharacterized protein YcnI